MASDPCPDLEGARRALVTAERLREIFEIAPVGIGVVDLRGRAILTNDALRAMLGYSVEEFATLPFDAFTHPDDNERNRQRFDEMVT